MILEKHITVLLGCQDVTEFIVMALSVLFLSKMQAWTWKTIDKDK